MRCYLISKVESGEYLTRVECGNPTFGNSTPVIITTARRAKRWARALGGCRVEEMQVNGYWVPEMGLAPRYPVKL